MHQIRQGELIPKEKYKLLEFMCLLIQCVNNLYKLNNFIFLNKLKICFVTILKICI